MNYNIVLLPGEALTEASIAASHTLSGAEPVEFILDNLTNYVHATLYMARIPEEQLDTASKRLDAIAKHTAALSLNAVGYGGGDGFSNISYDQTPELMQLQQDVLDKISPLRSGIPPEQQRQIQTAQGTALKGLTRYGFGSIGKSYNPHITLTRTTSRQKIDAESALGPVSKYSGSFQKLGIFVMGENGVCAEPVAIHRLRTS